MSLGLFKRTSNSKVTHRYENVPVTNASSHRKKRQWRRHDTDYINVEFDDKNGRRHLATIGEVKRQPKDLSTVLSASAIRDTTDTRDSADGGQYHEMAKNRLELNKTLENKSHSVQHRMNTIDSDSSSSEITESTENPEAQNRELEHYNRLKLNLRCLPHNEKVLKGIRILYNDQVPAERNQHSLQAALNSSTLFKQRQQYSLGEDPNEASFTLEKEKYQSRKYKNEGHVNRILSVTGRPIRHSPLSVSKTLSKSTGDVKVLHAEDTTTQVGFDPTSNIRPKSFSDIETTSVTSPKSFVDVRFSPFHSLEKRHSDSQNLQLPKAKVQQETMTSEKLSDGHTHSSNFSSSVDIQSPSTKETTKFLHANSQVSKHSEGGCLATVNNRRIRFISAIESTTFGHNGVQYSSQYHDVRISVPKGATNKHTTVELQVGVALHGPFSFPDEKRPVSPIVWVGMNPNTKLKKHMEIIIPHFVDRSGQSLSTELILLKATDLVKGGKKQYQFYRVAENNQYFDDANHGTVTTKHSCYFCIAGDMTNLTASYCLLPVIPQQITQTTWKIHYYITYLLKSHIHVRNKHYFIVMRLSVAEDTLVDRQNLYPKTHLDNV